MNLWTGPLPRERREAERLLREAMRIVGPSEAIALIQAMPELADDKKRRATRGRVRGSFRDPVVADLANYALRNFQGSSWWKTDAGAARHLARMHMILRRPSPLPGAPHATVETVRKRLEGRLREERRAWAILLLALTKGLSHATSMGRSEAIATDQSFASLWHEARVVTGVFFIASPEAALGRLRTLASARRGRDL